MSSLARSTNYTNQPYLNFDYSPLGATLNFFRKQDIYSFFEKFSDIKIDGQVFCINSIAKSHLPLSLLGDDYQGKLKIAYIYRNPADVFISFWKFLHRWDWYEVPKLDSPIELLNANPCGQSQRYQVQNYQTYFSRWAYHVSSAYKASLNSERIVCINYKHLLENHLDCIKFICDTFAIDLIKNPEISPRENYIKGTEMQISNEEIMEVRRLCSKEIKKHADLPPDLMSV